MFAEQRDNPLKRFLCSITAGLCVAAAASLGAPSLADAAQMSGSRQSPKQEVINPIKGSVEYYGQSGEAYAIFCPGEATNGPVNVLITLPGYSPGDVGREPDSFEVYQTCGGFGFGGRSNHLVKFGYKNGGDFIQRNGGAFAELIKTLNRGLRLGDDDRIVVVGNSMGGVVARYGLLVLESEGFEHHVDKMISIDAPQLGGYVPIGMQFLLDRFKPDAGTDSLAQLRAPAALQLSRYSMARQGMFPTWIDEFTQLFFRDMGERGFWPKGPKLVGVSSGRSDGVIEGPAPGSIFFQGSRTETKRVGLPGRSLSQNSCTMTFRAQEFELGLEIQATARTLGLEGWVLEPVAEIKQVDARVQTLGASELLTAPVKVDDLSGLYQKVRSRITGSPGCLATFGSDALKSRLAEEVTTDIQRILVNTADQWKAINDKTFYAYTDSVTSAGVPGGLRDESSLFRLGMERAGFRVNYLNQSGHSFIPLYSALGIPFLSPGEMQNMTRAEITERSPFDVIYMENYRNLNHTDSSFDWYQTEVSSFFKR